MSLTDLVSVALTVVALAVGGAWALIKVVVGQFKQHLTEKFAAQDKAREEGRAELRTKLDKLEDDLRKNEREHLKLLADLPMNYVRREDSIRMETVINAKLDALNSKIELMAERQLNKV